MESLNEFDAMIVSGVKCYSRACLSIIHQPRLVLDVTSGGAAKQDTNNKLVETGQLGAASVARRL
jgi:hypothetical protein